MTADKAGLVVPGSFRVFARPAVIDAEIAAFDPSKLLEPAFERGQVRLPYLVILGKAHEHPDASHPLLRPRRNRPCRRRAAEQRDERAAFPLIELHSIPASQAGL
jgi:hypothetical protein